eukprot:TRINITY_DN6234_c0_g1_i1.p1 TRINITY_DN6234_c0_g1~~TRINITY_DN6234_c0_g1_i1.p1  ORF type:complete len:173 (-),score=25.95 TRINITY_DN6234_c0_g1_i1:38-556(-)
MSELKILLSSFKKKTPEEIEQRWRDYHYKKACICGCIPIETYEKINKRLQDNPRFILPLPRAGEGLIEFLYLESRPGGVILFTRLVEFKEKGEKSIPSLTMIHFELSKQKLILMRGDVNTDSISTAEAGIIANLLQLYYLRDDMYEEVKKFNHDPEGFDHMNLLKGLKNSQI